MPERAAQAFLYDEAESLFDAYGIEDEIQRALSRKVPLPSGGYLVIDQAEALTAIDVNSGRYVGKKSLEETITKINIEAAKEIVYQLRLRNIGGIIICDFIDMEKPQNRDKVFKALQEALGRDKAKTNVLRISELGLVEMTRKRVRQDLRSLMTVACPACKGTGVTRSDATLAAELYRTIQARAAAGNGRDVLVRVHPDLAGYLEGDGREDLARLAAALDLKIVVQANGSAAREELEIRLR